MSGGWCDQRGEELGGVALHPGEDVLVHGHRERWTGVTEAFADDLERDAGLQQQGGMGVAQVVKPDARQAGTRAQPVEGLGEHVWMQWSSGDRREHDLGWVLEDLALACSPGHEDIEGLAVEIDAAA